MRKVGSIEEESQKRKRYAQIFSIALLVILTVSTLGYAFFSNPDTTSSTPTSSGSSVVQQISDGQWGFDIGSNQILLSTSPEQAKNITLKDQPNLADFTQQVVYIDGSDAVTTDLTQVLSPYASRVQSACYGACNRDVPEKDCNDTLIVWTDSNKQQIYKQDKCYFIDGNESAVDAFVYSLFGLLK